jgi:3-hydroxyacyl-[acyl-carrier-protein] dehydratase
VSGKEFIIDPATLDFTRVTADIEAIRKVNPQRFEMEQLTAVIYEDLEENICVGYKDITHNEFWIRGHMPGLPLMPGVVMLEAAAQISSYFTQRHDLMGTEMVGFGGLENVRFRNYILPGTRLILMCQLTKSRRGRLLVSNFQGIVDNEVVFDGMLKGIPIPVDEIRAKQGKQ